MVGIWSSTGTRLSVQYNSLELNSVSNVETNKTGYELAHVQSSTVPDYLLEPRQWTDGIELFGPREAQRIILVRGYVHGATQADLFDKVEALAKAFNPARIRDLNASDFFLAFDFSTPTADTSNYATGYIASRYYAFPLRMPEPPVGGEVTGFGVPYEVPLLLREPKRFFQTATSQAGNGTIDNSLADAWSWPTVTFTLSGAGPSNFTIQNVSATQGTKSLVLDLDQYTDGSWTVDFLRRQIKQGSTIKMDVLSSGDFFQIEATNSNAITFSNTTNVSSPTLTFRRAFCL